MKKLIYVSAEVRRLVSLVLVWALVISLFPGIGGVAQAAGHSHEGYTVFGEDLFSGLGEDESISLTPGNYYLTGNFALEHDVDIEGDVTICLNGFLLDAKDRIISVSEEGNLLIESCNENTEHYFTKGTTPLNEFYLEGDAVNSKIKEGRENYIGERTLSEEKTSETETFTGGIITASERVFKREFVTDYGSADEYFSVIAVRGGSLVLDNVDFIGCKGQVIDAIGQVDIYDCDFLGNVSAGNVAAGVIIAGDVEDPTTNEPDYYLYLKGCNIRDNVSSGPSGAILSTVKAIIRDCNITGNAGEITGGVQKFPMMMGCFARGTKITMADGSYKNIEDIELGDKVAAIDHETGETVSQRICSVFEGGGLVPFTLLFEDGNTVSICDSHSLLEKDSLKYINLSKNNAESYVGKSFYNAKKNQWVKLVDIKEESVPTSFYSVMSADTINVFANDMVSVSGDSDFLLNAFDLDIDLKYDTEKKEKDILTYGLLSYEEFKAICEGFDLTVSEEVFNNYNLCNLNVIIGKGIRTFDELINAGAISAMCKKEEGANVSLNNLEESFGEMMLLSDVKGEGERESGKDFDLERGELLIGSNTIIKGNKSSANMELFLNEMMGIESSLPEGMVESNVLVGSFFDAYYDYIKIIPGASNIDIGIGFFELDSNENPYLGGRIAKGVDSLDYLSCFSADNPNSSISYKMVDGAYDYYLEVPLRVYYREEIFDDPDDYPDYSVPVDNNQYQRGDIATILAPSASEMEMTMWDGTISKYQFFGWGEEKAGDIMAIYKAEDKVQIKRGGKILKALWVEIREGHTISLVPGKLPSCEEDGVRPLFYCEECDEYYDDEDCSEGYGVDNPEDWETGEGKIDMLGHSFAIESKGNALEAYCENYGCPTETGKDNRVSLSVTVPSENKAGTKVIATISDTTDWEVLGFEVPEIEFYKGGTKLDEAPFEAGNYEARITCSGVTAKAAFSINSAYVPPVMPPTSSTPSTPDTPQTPAGGTIGDDTGNNTTNISVNTSGGNAVIAEIPASTIDKVANTQAAGTTADLPPVKNDIVIDVSNKGNDGKDVTKVTLTKTTAENIVEALNSGANDKENLVIITSNATVTIDAKALEAIAVQAKEEAIQLVVENVQAATLNESQKAAVSALEKVDVVQTFEAYFVSGGSRISDFNGGMITVGKIDFEIPAGKNAKNYHIYYIPENGAAERYETWVEGGSLYFRTTHFSDYAIVYDEEIENDSFVTVYRLFNRVNGEHLITADSNEVDRLLATGKWSKDNDMGKGGREGTAVYRLFNLVSGEHLYTSDVNEIKKQTAKKIWVYDNNGKPIFYGLTEGTPVYRLFNPKNPGVSAHLNTSDDNEVKVLSGKGYKLDADGKAMFYLQ